MTDDPNKIPGGSQGNPEDETKTADGSLPEDPSADDTIDSADAAVTAQQNAAPDAAAPEAEGAPTEAAEEAAREPEPAPQKKTAAQKKPGTIDRRLAVGVLLLALLLVFAVFYSRETRGSEDTLQSTEAAETTAEETEESAAETAETTQATEIIETTAPTTPADGNPDDVTAKGSYSVTDEEAEASRDTVVATMGGKELTNAQLRVFYWMEVQGFLNSYASYASYFGLDYTEPLDTQLEALDGNNLTWQQYFLDCALNNWQQFQALALAGEKNGLSVSQENQEVLDSLEDTVNEMAENYSMTTEELLKANFGAGTGMAEYKNFQQLYYEGLPYYEEATAKLVPTEAELREYYDAHAEEYASGGVEEDDLYVSVRHILIQPEGGTTDDSGTTTYSDEEWEAARVKAQEILDEYLAGEQTEDAFAELATEYTEDTGSQSTGGLYEQVYEGQMVTEFNDWCFDESRESGDTDLIKTTYGYHVMYFVSSEPQWMYYAESDWTTEQTNALIEDLVSNYSPEISYDKISLGVVSLAG